MRSTRRPAADPSSKVGFDWPPWNRLIWKELPVRLGSEEIEISEARVSDKTPISNRIERRWKCGRSRYALLTFCWRTSDKFRLRRGLVRVTARGRLC